MAKDTDKELVRRVQKGDRYAFDLLFSRYQHKILNLVSRYLKDPQDVEDVTQAAFIKAFRALPRFRGTPVVIESPACRSAATPLPFTNGFGSVMAMTTRLTPERMTSGTQGGVRLLR